MKILETSPDGQLRLRQLKNGKGIVELQGLEGEWHWAIWRYGQDMNEARETFKHQLKYHL